MKKLQYTQHIRAVNPLPHFPKEIPQNSALPPLNPLPTIYN